MSSYNGRGVHGQVVEAVGRRIVQGYYPQEATLDLEELQREHDVSLTVIREALKVLAGKGLVDARQRRGTFVRPRSRWNLLDPDVLHWEITPASLPRMLEQLAEVRAIFEPAAAALAATRRTDSDIAAIRAGLSAMEAAKDASEATRADVAFHHAVLTATGNELLERVELLTRALLEERDLLVHRHVAATDPVDVHRALLDAIIAGDPDTARGVTEQLLGRAVADVSATIERADATTSGGASDEDA